MLIDPWRTIGFSPLLLLLLLLAATGTVTTLPLLERIGLSHTLDTQLDRVALTQARSAQALTAGEPGPVLLNTAAKALDANPYNARRWLDYALAAHRVRDFNAAHDALMQSMWLTPYDTALIVQRLYLFGALAHLLTAEERRLVVDHIRWAAGVEKRAVFRALIPHHSPLERFMRLHLIPVDQNLFLELIKLRDAERRKLRKKT